MSLSVERLAFDGVQFSSSSLLLKVSDAINRNKIFRDLIVLNTHVDEDIIKETLNLMTLSPKLSIQIESPG